MELVSSRIRWVRLQSGPKGADRIIIDSQTANPKGDDIAGCVWGHAAE